MTNQVIRHEQEKELSVHLMLLEKYEGIALVHVSRLIDLYKTGCVSAIDAGHKAPDLTDRKKKLRSVYFWSGQYGSGTKWTIELTATNNKSDWVPVRATCLDESGSHNLVAVVDPQYEGDYFFVPQKIDQMPKVVACLQEVDEQVRTEILTEWGLDPGLDDLMPGLNKAISRLATK